MDTQKIGHFLKKLRKESGMSQEQLGERLGVSNKTVSRWETGNYMPPVDMLIELADFYEVDIREILDGERKNMCLDKEQKEAYIKLADYSKYKEKKLLRKLLAIITIGIVAWGVSFSFLLCFVNSAKGAGFILICETIALLLYGVGMCFVKATRSAVGFLNTVLGAAIAVVVSNIALLAIFFGSGSYYNYGIIGAYYFIVILLAIFVITGILMSVISIKERNCKS